MAKNPAISNPAFEGWLKAMGQMNKQAEAKKHQCEWWSAIFQQREYCKTNASVQYDDQWWCVKHSKLVTKGGVRSG